MQDKSKKKKRYFDSKVKSDYAEKFLENGKARIANGSKPLIVDKKAKKPSKDQLFDSHIKNTYAKIFLDEKGKAKSKTLVEVDPNNEDKIEVIVSKRKTNL